MKKNNVKRLSALLMSALLIAPTFGNAVQAEELSNETAAEYNQVDAYVLGSKMDTEYEYEYAKYWGLATTPYESEFIIPKYGQAEHSMTDNACLFNLISPDKLANTPEENQVGAWASIIAYCVDVRVDIDSDYMYRRINLEDSTYFDKEAAQKIRTIVNNGITVKTAVEVQEAANQWLAANKKDKLKEVTAEEVLAAAQFAIWATANENEIVGEPVAYNRCASERWSYVWNHEPANEYTFSYNVAGGEVSINSRVSEADNAETNIKALVDYYMAMEGSPASAVAVSDTSLKNVAVDYTLEQNGTYTAVVTFDVDSSLDLDTTSELTLSVICGDVNQTVALTETGSKSFTLTGLQEKADITVEINGYQEISDVFFFDALGERGVSQTLVGCDDSKLPVHAEATIGVDRMINITKTTVKDNVKYPLEGIKFDIYYLCTVDEYTEECAKTDNKYATFTKDMVAGQTPVATVTTDLAGKASYNLTKNEKPDGIYLIVEREHPAIENVLDPFPVAVPMTSEDGSGLIYTINLEPKNDVIDAPEVKKDVTEINNDKDSFDVNEEHTWIIRGDVPADMAAAKEYVISDELDYRLTYKDGLTVKVATSDARANTEEENNVLVKGADYTVEVSTGSFVSGGDNEEFDKFEVKLTKAGMEKVAGIVGERYADYEVRVYFKAVIDEDASMGVEIPNQAKLIYTNSVNFKYETESDEPVVYTCGINIYKHDAKDSDVALAGAKFKLAKVVDQGTDGATPLVTKDGTKPVVYEEFYDIADLTGEKVSVVTTTDKGAAVIYGLEEGEYYLVEIQAPSGYNLLSYPVAVTLDKASHLKENVVDVANSNTFKLPETGGIGTTIFAAGGMTLIAAAFVILVMKKRENEEA